MPAYEPVAMRWASRLAWAPVNCGLQVVEISGETSSETPLEALSAPGRSIRQPPKATAAIVMPTVRYMREQTCPRISACEGQSWSRGGSNAHWSQSATGS